MTFTQSLVQPKAGPRLQRPRVSIEVVGIAAAVAIWLVVWAFGEPWSRFLVAGQDARCYWVPGYDAPYALSEWTAPIAYVYSPAFLQLLAPLKVQGMPRHLHAVSGTGTGVHGQGHVARLGKELDHAGAQHVVQLEAGRAQPLCVGAEHAPIGRHQAAP